ncbi:MAG: DUF6252 family protein [Bernardetiaceae bacterium]
MKKMQQMLPWLLLFLTLGLAACGSDDDEATPASPALNGTMRATINGNAWEATISLDAVVQGPALVIVGTTDRNSEGLSSTISLNLFGVSAPGTFAVDGSDFTNPSSATYAYTTGTSANDVEIFNSLGNSGSVVISSISSQGVEGTFSFVGRTTSAGNATRTISNGSFSVRF